MIKAYINYPDPHVTAHYDPSCGLIQAQHKSGQRFRRINPETISEELLNHRDKKYSFGTSTDINDMSLEIDFNDRAFELFVLEYICRLLGKHYSRFEGLKPSVHC